MTDDLHDQGLGLAEQFAEVSRVLLAPGSVNQTLARIAQAATAVLEGCDEAGVCCDGDAVRIPQSDVMLRLDALQHELGEGPCVDVMGGRDRVHVVDLLDDGRWPRFGPLAVAEGLRSVLAHRLSVDGVTVGALQLFSCLPDAFDAGELTQALLFSAHAGLALAVSQAHASQERAEHDLRTALLSREVIGQAQGILMEREQLTADQAFDLLRRSSQHLNRKLRDVAQDLVDTGVSPPVA